METDLFAAVVAREAKMQLDANKLSTFKQLGMELGFFPAIGVCVPTNQPIAHVSAKTKSVFWDDVLKQNTLNKGYLPRFLAENFRVGNLRMKNGKISSWHIREFLEMTGSKFMFMTDTGILLAMKRLGEVVPGWKYVQNGTGNYNELCEV